MNEWIYFISLTSQLLEYGPGVVLSFMPSTYWYQEIFVEISTDVEHAVNQNVTGWSKAEMDAFTLDVIVQQV